MEDRRNNIINDEAPEYDENSFYQFRPVKRKNMYLIINNDASKYTDKYRLVEDEREAVDEFNKLGYSKQSFGMRINTKPGMMNSVSEDGANITIGLINLEVK